MELKVFSNDNETHQCENCGTVYEFANGSI